MCCQCIALRPQKSWDLYPTTSASFHLPPLNSIAVVGIGSLVIPAWKPTSNMGDVFPVFFASPSKVWCLLHVIAYWFPCIAWFLLGTIRSHAHKEDMFKSLEATKKAMQNLHRPWFAKLPKVACAASNQSLDQAQHQKNREQKKTSAPLNKSEEIHKYIRCSP